MFFHSPIIAIIIFFQYIAYSNAFLKPNQPIVSNRFVKMTPISNTLESIIANKAIISSIATILKREITAERIMIELDNFTGPSSFFYTSMILTYMYGEYRFTQGAESKADKIKKLPLFKETEKMYRELFFVLMFVLFKDVHSAS